MERDEDDSADEGSESRLRIGETLRKLMSVGLGAAFMTEEHVKAYLADIKLPKEVLSGFLQGAQKSKEELVAKVSGEVVRMIQKIDFVKEASRFVEDHKFKIHAEIEIVPKSRKAGTAAPED